MDINSPLDGALFAASKGYRVHPIAEDAKHPLTPRGFLDATSDHKAIYEWWSRWPNANVAVATEGLLVLDVDGFENPWLTHDRVESLMQQGPMVTRTPRGGRHYWFRAPMPVPCSVGKIAEKVDVRGGGDRHGGGYVLIPPSKVGGKPYMWATEIDALNELPMAPPWLMVAALSAGEEGGPATPRDRSNTAAPGNVIPDGQRNSTLASLAGTMRRAGMGEAEIKAALLSTNRERCNPPLDEREVIKIAASVSRYEPDQLTVAVVEDWHAQDRAEAGSDKEKLVDPGPFPEELLQPGGFMQEVMEFNLKTAQMPQPVLALASAIALQAVLAGRKVKDPLGNRTNLYIVGLAGSGAGKNNGRKVNQEILTAAGCDTHLGNPDIASDAGLLSAVENEPAILFQIDEIGRWLAACSNPKAAPHMFNIVTTLMRLYSDAGSVYKGKAYSDRNKNLEIHQPCVCLNTFADPEWFYGSLSAEMLRDGFVARLLIFECQDRPEIDWIDEISPPESLLDQVRWWGGNAPPGNLQKHRPSPRVVPHTPEARSLLLELARDSSKQTSHTSLWARVAEKACRLALCYAVSRDCKNPVVDTDAVIWGGALSQYLTHRLVYDIRHHIAESDYEKRKNKIIAAVRRLGGEVSATQLTAATRWINQRDRDEIVKDLVLAGELIARQEDTHGRPRIMYKLLAS